MATKNGNLLSLKTAKIKEPPNKPATTTTPPIVAAATGSALKSTAKPNRGKLPPTPPTNLVRVNNWPGALPTFLPPHDLYLGGKGPKKVFTPNLVIKRSKNLNVKTSKDTTAKRGGASGRGGRGANSSRGGRGGKTSTLVETKGLFSEGAGDFLSLRKPGSQSRYGGTAGGYRGSGDNASSTIIRPILKKNDYKKIDIKADENKLFDIAGDSDGEQDFDNYKTEAGEDLPISLVEVESRAKLKKIKASKLQNVPLKTDIKTENEADGAGDVVDDATALATAQKLQKLHVQETMDTQIKPESLQALPRFPLSVNQFLDMTDAPLFLLQLPATLPCETDDASNNFVHKKETVPTLNAPTTSRSAIKRYQGKPDYDLSTMQEGQIGKIVRYKSGKVRLLLSETYFDLNMGLEPGFMQDVVSIRPKDKYEQDAAAIVNLGPLKAKITATPPWEEYLPFTDNESIAGIAAASNEQEQQKQQLA